MLKTIINTLLFLTPILVMIFIALFQRKTKKLSYEVILDIPLVTVSSKIKDKIRIYFDSKVVENPQLVIVRFTNTGNQPISKSDFEENIVLKFSDISQIIQCDASELFPENLRLEFNHDQNSVTINPLLINERESFNLNLIIDNHNFDFYIIDRIKGLRVEKYKEPFFISSTWFNILLTLSVYLLIIFLILYNLEPVATPEGFINRLNNIPIYVLMTVPTILVLNFYPSMYRFIRKIKYSRR